MQELSCFDSYASIGVLSEDLIIMGYSAFSRFSVYQWDPKKKQASPLGGYAEVKRSVVKTIGSTRSWVIKNIKRSRWVKHQFFCSTKGDLLRVNLDMTPSKKVHPNDILFRGETEILDYQLVDSIYIAILFQYHVYVIDQYTEQIVSVFKDMTYPQKSLLLGPGFEVDVLPLIICSFSGGLVTEDVQMTGAAAQIPLLRYGALHDLKEVGFSEASRTRVLFCRDDDGGLKIVTIVLP